MGGSLMWREILFGKTSENGDILGVRYKPSEIETPRNLRR